MMAINKGCWKFDEQDKALYIDLETNSDDEELSYSAWDQLPDILLEQIFSYLSIKQRYYASLVCRSWYRAFKLPNVWSKFTLQDNTLTRGKYNYYSGWCYVLDHMKTSTCLNKVGKHFKSLVLEPMDNFNNLYDFMNMISWYSERHQYDTSVPGVGNNIRHLKFIFPCNMANSNDPEQMKVYGTGGKILEALMRLAQNLKNLRSLEFTDFMLDSKEALYFLDTLCFNCTETLRQLVLVNATKFYCPLLHIGVFLNLNVLVVSPQNLDEDVLELISHTKLQHMHIFRNRYSPVDSTVQLPKNSAWIKLRKTNPNLMVHFEVENNKPEIFLPIEFPDHNAIPCRSIVINNPTISILPSMMLAHAVNFYSTLAVYAMTGVPKYFQHRSFTKRLDEVLVRLCQTCPNMHTLMINNKISTSTLLEIVSTAKSLRYLYVRRNVVLKRCDKAWPMMTNNSTAEHEKWIRSNCNSYEKTETEVSRILRYRWHMLSEKEFKFQAVNLHV